jgi:gliding motility-associated-like protein
LFIPNAFTPTKPGDNDIFKVSGIGFVNDEFEMLIFNRWGDLIFKTNDINKGWDGYKGSKLCKLDNYVYKIIVKDFKNKIREFTGYITLL